MKSIRLIAAALSGALMLTAMIPADNRLFRNHSNDRSHLYNNCLCNDNRSPNHSTHRLHHPSRGCQCYC